MKCHHSQQLRSCTQDENNPKEEHFESTHTFCEQGSTVLLAMATTGYQIMIDQWRDFIDNLQ